MHYLDSLIDDIEPRMQSILDTSPTIPETTIQTSLISYCWILLDSWIAWTTYRFLLRDSLLDQDIPDKWIRTPSSYRCNQIQSIWKFGKDSIRFFERNTGESLKNAIDTTIQARRNASAHFSRDFENMVRGDDIRRIKAFFIHFQKYLDLLRSRNCSRFYVLICLKHAEYLLITIHSKMKTVLFMMTMIVILMSL